MALHDPCVDGNGVIQGMDQAALDIYARYVTPPQGIYGVGATVIPTLPYPEWAWYSYLEVGTVSLSVAQGPAELLYTVPDDERNRFLGVYCLRNSGDNTLAGIQLLYPEPYRGGTGLVQALSLATAADRVSYPSLGPTPAVDNQLWSGPFIMEPGTAVRLSPGGVGSSTTVVAYHIQLERSKIIRAREPVL